MSNTRRAALSSAALMILVNHAFAEAGFERVRGPNGMQITVPTMANVARRSGALDGLVSGPVLAVWNGSGMGITCDLFNVGDGQWYAISTDNVFGNHGFHLSADSRDNSLLGLQDVVTFSVGDIIQCGLVEGGWYQATSILVGNPH